MRPWLAAVLLLAPAAALAADDYEASMDRTALVLEAQLREEGPRRTAFRLMNRAANIGLRDPHDPRYWVLRARRGAERLELRVMTDPPKTDTVPRRPYEPGRRESSVLAGWNGVQPAPKGPLGKRGPSDGGSELRLDLPVYVVNFYGLIGTVAFNVPSRGEEHVWTYRVSPSGELEAALHRTIVRDAAGKVLRERVEPVDHRDPKVKERWLKLAARLLTIYPKTSV